MLPNLIIFLAGLFTLYFIAMLWLRQNLVSELGALHQNELILRTDLEKRRNLVPFLLEGVRESAPITDAWQMLARERSTFVQMKSLNEEFEFAQHLQTFLDQTPCKTVTFLEAKKDIVEVGTLVEDQKIKLRNLALDFNAKRKQFPYSLASAIFGVREVTPL